MVSRAQNILQRMANNKMNKQESEHDSYGRLMAHNSSFVPKKFLPPFF